MSGVSFTRAHTYPSQTGLHRRRTREEDWVDHLDDDEIMNEEYDRASGSPYYPPPPNAEAPPPPLDSVDDLHHADEMKVYGSVAAISMQSFSSAASFSAPRGSPPPSDGQVMRSTSSLGQAFADDHRSHSQGGVANRAAPRMASFPPLSEEYAPSMIHHPSSSSSGTRALNPTAGLRPAASWTHPVRAGSGSSYQQHASPSRIGEEDERLPPSPTVGWLPRGVSPSPLQPPTSAYSRSSRIPPSTAPEEVVTIHPPPQGYPSGSATARDKVEEWALRWAGHDRMSRILNIPETPRPPT